MRQFTFYNKKLFIVFIIVGFAVTAVFLCMASTLNPWSQKLPHLDSAVWLRCAVEMKQGKVIYRDTWDHKGPILFFINYLGLTLTPHSLTGIWILECISAFLTLVSFYFVAGLITESVLVRFLASVLSMQPFYYFFQQMGNCVEEWALPFIGFSLYFFTKYLKTFHITKSEILLAGMFMGCSFLLNGNLVAVWVCFVPIIASLLIYRKDYKDLGTCVSLFMSGLLLVFVVTALVLLLQGAWPAFWATYFGFNHAYVSGVTWRSFTLSVLNFAYMDDWFGYSHVLLLFLLLHDKKIVWKWCFLPYAVVTLLLISVSGRGYHHYGIQLIPCMIIPMAECLERVLSWCNKYIEFLFIIVVVIVLWLRFDIERYEEEMINWTLSEEGDNYMAGGVTENYTIVNDWIGGRWSDEAIDKWVTNELW